MLQIQCVNMYFFHGITNAQNFIRLKFWESIVGKDCRLIRDFSAVFLCFVSHLFVRLFDIIFMIFNSKAVMHPEVFVLILLDSHFVFATSKNSINNQLCTIKSQKINCLQHNFKLKHDI